LVLPVEKIWPDHARYDWHSLWGCAALLAASAQRDAAGVAGRCQPISRACVGPEMRPSRFDGANSTRAGGILRVTEPEFLAPEGQLDESQHAAIDRPIANVRCFHTPSRNAVGR